MTDVQTWHLRPIRIPDTTGRCQHGRPLNGNACWECPCFEVVDPANGQITINPRHGLLWCTRDGYWVAICPACKGLIQAAQPVCVKLDEMLTASLRQQSQMSVMGGASIRTQAIRGKRIDYLIVDDVSAPDPKMTPEKTKELLAWYRDRDKS